MSLDQAHHILAWPTAELDPPRLAVQGQVRQVIMTIDTKAALDGTLGRDFCPGVDRGAFAAAPAAGQLPPKEPDYINPVGLRPP